VARGLDAGEGARGRAASAEAEGSGSGGGGREEVPDLPYWRMLIGLALIIIRVT
jgi:hypothetical protein